MSKTSIAADPIIRQPSPTSALILRPYQQEALDAIKAAEQRQCRRVLISLPTGCGKTIIFSHLIHQQPGRCLILVHRDELIGQTLEKLALVNPLMDVGVIKAERNELNPRVVVASVQTISRPKRLCQLGTDFRMVIVDEAHHTAAMTYQLVLEYLSSFESYGPLLAGFTATPERFDRSPLGRTFEEIVYQKSILEMIPQYLCDLRAIQVQLVKADFNSLHIRNGEYRGDEVEEMLLAADAPEEVAEAFGKYAIGRKALIFTSSVALAYAMKDAFRAVGIRSIEALDGETPTDKRRAILRRLHTGQTQIVANCAVLTEGFDEPSIDCIVITRPTRSRPTYSQMVGRGTRKFPGKEDCLVLDCVGATTRHDLMTISKLFNLPEKSLKDQTITEAIEAEARRKTAVNLPVDVEGEDANTQQVAMTVDLFQRRPMRWLNVDQAYSLSLGEEGWVALRPDAGERWGVWVIGKFDGSTKPITQGLTLEGAQVVAEDYVRQSGAAGLTWRQASWRHKAVTEYPKMVNMLRWLKIPVGSGMTAGHASDLIGHAELRKRLASIGEVTHE